VRTVSVAVRWADGDWKADMGILMALCLLLAPRAMPAQTAPASLACAAATADQDHDGLSDACELAFAQDFAPLLVVRSGGCNWDDSASPARPGGGYLFAAQPVDSNTIRIAFLPAYYRDCGWHGSKCWLPGVDCAPHVGDSEFIVVEVRRHATQWVTNAVFLSAHCFGKHGQACRWYGGDELARFDWIGGAGTAPVIWVAEGRQANYPSKQACDAGIHHIDTCDHNSVRIRYPVVSNAQNIGSLSFPAHDAGCIKARAVWPSVHETIGTAECFWAANALFAGWQADRAGVTPYYKYLAEIAGFGAK
jgi:hypothetical protein